MDDKRKQNLEKDEIADDDTDGVLVTPKLDDEMEHDDSFENDFDDDGNYIGTDDGQEPPDDEEPFKDDMTPEPEPIVEPVKANKQLSPEAIKIINLKKELAESQRSQRELLEAQKKSDLVKETASRVEKLVEQGYDPDTAKNMTTTDLRIAQLEEKTAKFDFMEDNTDAFDKYPQAKANVLTIMNNSKLTGMTADQICKGLYGTAELPAHEQRALNSVKGQVSTGANKPNLNNARVQSTGNDTLSPQELRDKAFLEKKFNDGEQIPMNDYNKKYRY